jgi:predicted metal-dependent peptidase
MTYQMQGKNQMKKIEKARARMLLKHPFFATLTLSCPLEVDNNIPTAATDMRKIIYNEQFIEDLKVDVVEFVIAHEVAHVMFKHGLRRNGRNPKMWNVACDYAINYILHESGFEIWDQCLFDKKYAGMSAEQIYDLLEKEYGGKGGKEGGNDGLPSDGLGDDLTEGEPLSPEERAVVDRQIEQRIAQAASVARMAGKLSGGLERFVNEILNPAVPWQDLLREYMTRVVHDDESWSRRNRRFTNVFLPSKHNVKMGEVVIIGDTSGSITNAELARIGSEAASLAESVKPESIRLVWADTEVAGEQVFDTYDTIVPEPKGGGGTDMRVPLAHVEQYDPQVVILVTDGYTPWPEVEPNYPLIVCCTTNVEVPIGQVVRIS